MLEPDDRRVLLEALRPPEGYVVDRALATTYSLDLIALLVAPLSFSLFDRIARRGDPAADDSEPLGATALLQAVRAHAEKLVVFCQAGCIARPAQYRQLLAYLEGSVVQVRARSEQGVFHPKVWVQRFTPTADGPVRYRVLVNSRNLTFDRSWDTMLSLEGELKDRTNAIARNHPLGDFLAALPGLAVRPASGRVVTDTALLADEVRRVAFTEPEDFEDLRFWPLGHDDRARWPFDTRIDRMLVVSPFVAAETLERLTATGSGHVLVSRTEELARFSAAALGHFDEVHVLNEGAEGEREDGDAGDDGGAGESSTTDTAARGLHAKLYIADAGRSAHVWTGSANATRAAFHENVELLVQLTGKKGKVGIDAALGDAGGAAALRALLVAFTPSEEAVPDDPVDAALDARLRALRLALGGAPWRAMVERELAPDDGAERYRVHLRAEGARIDLGQGAEVSCWPIALPPEHATGLSLSGAGASATFSRCSFQALTSFFAFRVVVHEGARTARIVFVVNVPLDGAPEHRHARILHAMLDDPTKVMRFLRMLLALDPAEGIEALLDAEGTVEGPTSRWPGGGSGTPLLEALLRALEHEPERLREFERAVRELGSTAGGAAVLPPDLDRIWEPIRAAWEAQRSRGGRS
ncbi:phospholipase D family protein [Sorangium sp. So ce513]|uniref:phospholipase D family protein n=1 Tax=Sorangium sp. So ce513 TaxID=3133315 RepID=UPI003F62C4AC